MHSIQEGLTLSDSIESWISKFISCKDTSFNDKSKKDRIVMALEAYYEDAEAPNIDTRRELKIVELSTGSPDKALVRYFTESADAHTINSVLTVRDLYESFVGSLVEDTIIPNMPASIKCIAKWGTCGISESYEGQWKQTAHPDQLRFDVTLPSGASSPNIVYNKKTKTTDIPKQFELL